MVEEKSKTEWRIWMIVLTPFIGVLLNMHKFVFIFKEVVFREPEQGGRPFLLFLLLVLPILNIVIYFF